MIQVHGTIYEKNGEYYVFEDEIKACPKCGGELKYRDTKKRWLIDAGGNVCIYHLRRSKCKSCGVLHTLLPDTMIPYKRYSRACIEAAVAGNDDGCIAETSTINRWRCVDSVKERIEE